MRKKKKDEVSEEDVELMKNLIKEIKKEKDIFMLGELKMNLDSINRSLRDAEEGKPIYAEMLVQGSRLRHRFPNDNKAYNEHYKELKRELSLKNTLRIERFKELRDHIIKMIKEIEDKEGKEK